MKSGTFIGIGLVMAVLMAAPAADARDGRPGPKRSGPAVNRKAVSPPTEPRHEEPVGAVDLRGIRIHPAPRYRERPRDRDGVQIRVLGSLHPRPSRPICVTTPRVRYWPGLYSYFSWPSGYVSLSVPYTHTVTREYTHYVVLDTPTVTSPSTAVATGPYGIPLKPAPPKSDAKLFDSRLAPMLGGSQKVPAAFALGEQALRDGDFDQAAFAFRQALLETPDEPAAHIALSMALVAVEDYEGAGRALKQGLRGLEDVKVVQLDPPGAFGPGGTYDRIAERLRGAAQNDPANRDVQLLLGFHYFAIGHFGQAGEVLWAAQDAGPKDLVMLELLLAAERQSQAEAKDEAPVEEQQEATE